MFPTGFRGEFEVVAVEYEAINVLLLRVERELRAARALNVCRRGNKVSFRGGIFRLVSNWNVLVPVGSGEIEVVPGNPAAVRYRFSCVEMLTFVTVVASALGVFLFTIAGISVAAFIFPIFIWFSMFGLNFLIASERLPAFVRKAVRA
jgi:hypothetical protein